MVDMPNLSPPNPGEVSDAESEKYLRHLSTKEGIDAFLAALTAGLGGRLALMRGLGGGLGVKGFRGITGGIAGAGADAALTGALNSNRHAAEATAFQQAQNLNPFVKLFGGQ